MLRMIVLIRMMKRMVLVDVAENEMEGYDVEDDEVKGEENDDVENDDVEEEENGAVEDDDVEKVDRSQDRDPHFVRACAVEMQAPVYAKKIR